MFDFLKTCGTGLLYIFLLPFLLIIVCINAIYSLIVFIFMFFKRIIMFFSGDDMKDEMKIDKLAKFHIKQQDEEEEKEKTIQAAPIIERNNITTTVVQPIIIQTDENGVLKSVQVAPTTNPLQQPAIESQPIEQIETRVEEVEENVEDEEEDYYD